VSVCFAAAPSAELGLAHPLMRSLSVSVSVRVRALMWAYRLIQNVASIIDIKTLQSWSLQGTKRLVLGAFGQDCHTACASAGLSCSDAAFPYRVLNQDWNMVRALFRAVGLQCSNGNEHAGTNRPYARWYYNHDAYGAQTTLWFIRCDYGYRASPPGSTVHNLIPECGVAERGMEETRLCPCGRY
jgi:hypothetical protein